MQIKHGVVMCTVSFLEEDLTDLLKHVNEMNRHCKEHGYAEDWTVEKSVAALMREGLDEIRRREESIKKCEERVKTLLGKEAI